MLRRLVALPKLRALALVLLSGGALVSSALAQNQPAEVPDFTVRAEKVRAELAKLPKDKDSEARRTALQARLKLLERGIELQVQHSRLVRGELERRDAVVQQARALPPLEEQALGWSNVDTSKPKWQLAFRRDELSAVRSKIDAERRNFVALEEECDAHLKQLAEENTLASTRTELALTKERSEATSQLAALRTRLEARGKAALKGEPLRLASLRREVLELQLGVLDLETTRKTKWREVLAHEIAFWTKFREALRTRRLAPIRKQLAEVDARIAELAAALLPAVKLPAQAPAAVRSVFEAVRARVRETIRKVAKRNSANDVLQAEERQVANWRDEAKARRDRALKDTVPGAQSSDAVLYFKLRMARTDLERSLRNALEDSRWNNLPTQVASLKNDLDTAAAKLASTDARIETALRTALGNERGPIAKDLRAPMREWAQRERAQLQQLVTATERAMLSALTGIAVLEEQRDVLVSGIRELDRRGLWLRDPSRFRVQAIWWTGEIWIQEGPRTLGNLVALPAQIWHKAMHASRGAGTARLRFVLAILAGLGGLLAALAFRRRARELLARVARGAEQDDYVPERRLVNAVALAGLLWRAAVPAGLGVLFLLCAGIDTLPPEDARVARAIGLALVVGGFWWGFTKICTRPLRPRVRLLHIDDVKARRLHLLSITGLAMWLLGQFGELTYGLVPDIRGAEVAQALGTVRNAGLILVLLVFFLMRNLLRQLFRAHADGGVRFLQGFVLLLMWPARLALFAALVLLVLSYHGLAAALGLSVLSVLGAVVVGVVSHETIREELRYRFVADDTSGRKLLGGWLEILELAASLLLMLLTFSLIQGWSWAEWKELGATHLWGEIVRNANGKVIGDESIRVGSLVAFVVTVLLTLAVARRSRRTIELLLQDQPRFDRGLRYTLGTLTFYMLGIVGMLLAFSFLHLGFNKLQWMVAALSLGIGFGLQEIISNFVSGIILLFERPLRVGDVVQVDATVGEVRKITIRSTTITSYDNIDVIVPNKDFVTKSIINWTASDRDMRSKIELGVAYGTNLKRVRELLLETVKKHGRVYKKPAPSVYLVSFGDSTIDFSVRYWTSLDHKLSTFSDLHFAIEAAFARENIEIPFPQQDIHFRDPLELRSPVDERGTPRAGS